MKRTWYSLLFSLILSLWLMGAGVVLAQPPPPGLPPVPGGPAGAPCGAVKYHFCGSTANGPNVGNCISEDACNNYECINSSGNSVCDPQTYEDGNCTVTCSDVGGGATCGNGTIDVADGEDCDGTNLGGETCQSQGFTGGALRCNATTCYFDLSQCTGGGGTGSTCGNGFINVTNNEDCDGTNLGGETCQSQGYTGGTLTCNPTTCYFDLSQCTQGGGNNGGGGNGGGGNGGGGNGPTVPEPAITSIMDFYIALKAVAKWLLVFGIILGVLFVIIGGVTLLTSQGDPSKLATGKKTITWAIAGIVVLVLSYSLVNMIAAFFGTQGPIITP